MIAFLFQGLERLAKSKIAKDIERSEVELTDHVNLSCRGVLNLLMEPLYEKIAVVVYEGLLFSEC